MAQIVLGKESTKGLDGSVQKTGLQFLQKLTHDDTSASLRVKPLASAVDKRVRTARVNDDMRAVLFKFEGGSEPIYLLHGVWPHDEGNRIAASIRAEVDPVHGMFSIVSVDPAALKAPASAGHTGAQVPSGAHASTARDRGWPHESATGPSANLGVESATRSPAGGAYIDHSKLSYSWLGSYGYTAAKLQEDFGLAADVANRAMTCENADQLFEYAAGCTGWVQDVLLSLAAGESKEEILKEYGLEAQPSPGVGAAAEAEAKTAGSGAEGAEEPSSIETVTSEPTDAQLVQALKTDQAKAQFTFVEAPEELVEIISSGTLGQWRKFLHPQQRRYATIETSGPFRLSGGAGTGKTVVLLHRARHLARKDPNARIVLTTFGKTLADDLKDQLRQLDHDLEPVELGEPGVHIASVDSLVHRAISNAMARGNTARVEQAMRDVLGTVRTGLASRGGPDWRDAIATSGITLEVPGRSLASFLEEEYREVVLPNRIHELVQYLRVRRPGRGVGLNRAQRIQVWKAIEQYRSDAQITGGLTFPEAAAVAARQMKLRIEEGDPYYADSVLVDEGQDLSAVQWQFLRGLVGAHPDDMFIAEDAQQRIYGRQLVLSHYGIAIVGRSRRLTLNYRTTAENLERAVLALEGGEYVTLEGDAVGQEGLVYRSARRGPRPTEISVGSAADAINELAEVVRRWHADGDIEPEAIAVLTPYREQASQVAAALAEHGIRASVVRSSSRYSGVGVMTLHRAKGLEFLKVALLLGSPVDMSAVSESHSQSLHYVAMTRARDELAIINVTR